MLKINKTIKGDFMKLFQLKVVSAIQLLFEHIRGIATEPQAEGYIPREEIIINGKEV